MLTAVDDLDLSVPAGGTLGLVGESGSGKSTVARALVHLVPAVAGQVLLDGEDVTYARHQRLRALRKRLQMVFQDPYSSLNPRITIGEILEEAIQTHRTVARQERTAEVQRLLELVSLDGEFARRYPHQFSGGQRQRIAIARALAVEPEIIILDEVASALDVSVQANILNLLKQLQRQFYLSYLFISHDLSVVRYMCDSIAVMYLGRIVESAPTEELFQHPRHPYTRGLIDSIPKLAVGNTSRRLRVSGEIPDPRNPPAGCRFHTRCPIGPLAHPERTACIELDPNSLLKSGQQAVACHFPLHGNQTPTHADALSLETNAAEEDAGHERR